MSKIFRFSFWLFLSLNLSVTKFIRKPLARFCGTMCELMITNKIEGKMLRCYLPYIDIPTISVQLTKWNLKRITLIKAAGERVSLVVTVYVYISHQSLTQLIDTGF